MDIVPNWREIVERMDYDVLGFEISTIVDAVVAKFKREGKSKPLRLDDILKLYSKKYNRALPPSGSDPYLTMAEQLKRTENLHISRAARHFIIKSLHPNEKKELPANQPLLEQSAVELFSVQSTDSREPQERKESTNQKLARAPKKVRWSDNSTVVSTSLLEDPSKEYPFGLTFVVDPDFKVFKYCDKLYREKLCRYLHDAHPEPIEIETIEEDIGCVHNALCRSSVKVTWTDLFSKSDWISFDQSKEVVYITDIEMFEQKYAEHINYTYSNLLELGRRIHRIVMKSNYRESSKSHLEMKIGHINWEQMRRFKKSLKIKPFYVDAVSKEFMYR